MPYITIKQLPYVHQISFEDILAGEDDVSKYMVPNLHNTRTRYVKELSNQFRYRFDYMPMYYALGGFCEKYTNLLAVQDKQTLYRKFQIPKRHGGLREINEPNPELMNALRELKQIFETKFFAMYHTSAFAYVKGRCHVDAVRRHQKNGSRWFLKTDFSNFFGSMTEEFVYRMISDIFPFSELVKMGGGEELLKKALSLCFLNGGLPQGTPISPMLTNLVMIPIDHYLNNKLRNFNDKKLVYTRYADDILISSQVDFQWGAVVNYMNTVLTEFKAPFSFNQDKTRYGSAEGSNWNLGVILNKDGDITVGHKNKKYFKAMLHNFICDWKSGVKWELHDMQKLQGIWSYYRSVEKDNIDYIVKDFDEKHKSDVLGVLKEEIKKAS